MNKTKCTKIVSIGLTVLLLCGLLCVPAVAEENLVDFVNPEFAISKVDGNDTVLGWSGYSSYTMEEIYTPDEVGYDSNAPMVGNMFHSVTHGHGIKTTDYISINEARSGYVTFWYKSEKDDTMRMVVESYNDNGTVGSENFSLKSTNGVWKQKKVIFTAKNGATKVKIGFRFMNYTKTENNVTTIVNAVSESNGYIMAPSYSLNVPIAHVADGDFESGIYTPASPDDATKISIKTEVNNNLTNSYLEIDALDTTKSQIRAQILSSQEEGKLLSKNKRYKLSFKSKFISGTVGELDPRVGIFAKYSADNTTKESQISSNIASIPLGAKNSGNWTEYIYYFSLTDGKNLIPENTNAWIMFYFYGYKGSKIAYDDIVIEEATNDIMVYQNGVETTTLTSGVSASARYHNASAHSTTFMVAYYEENFNVKTLKDVLIKTAEQNGDDAVIDFTVPADGNTYTVKVFAWDMSTGLTPDVKTEKVKVVAIAA